MNLNSKAVQKEIDERTNLTSTNKFELLLFRLGNDAALGKSELFGINVFKVREIVAMPNITPIAGTMAHSLGVVNLRGQVIPVLDLPAIVGCTPQTGLNIMLVTEYARTTQAFAVESVEDIVRLDWKQVLSAETSGTTGKLVTSIARLDGNTDESRLAQVLDVEAILKMVSPSEGPEVTPEKVGAKLKLKPGTIVLAADDSFVARSLIEQELKVLQAPYEMLKSGKEAWDRLNVIAKTAEAEGLAVSDKVAMVLTDLEMPEMDGFTLTRNIKQDARFNSIPVVIHSSLSGSANEDHVRSVGADGYVAKFVAEDLASTIRRLLPH
ncbi:chemotaxis protein [Delftia sp. PS-11]|uniref:chemotaxis protein n=1 Tax=Delftia sp. PS-11 TaxID=2767222 RepID=UPI002454335B|nr:chemotaxis protein [Delftia sp. PS-11]KAJ8744097.1 chemotaxis protein CheV [Delftia sp. PS-11]